MWITALFGMATKYAEAFLAIYFRERNSNNNIVGGPMYYIKNGLDKKYHFLAYLFAIFGMTAAFGIGNGVQVNSVSQVINIEFGISTTVIGFVTALLVGLVILGGIKSIGNIASKLVPTMSLLYIFGGRFKFKNLFITLHIFHFIVLVLIFTKNYFLLNTFVKKCHFELQTGFYSNMVFYSCTDYIVNDEIYSLDMLATIESS